MGTRIDRASASPDPRALVSSDLQHCYTDLILSRKAIMVSERTLVFYEYTAGQFIRWLVYHEK